MSTARDMLDMMTDDALATALWIGVAHCDPYPEPCAVFGEGHCPGHPLDESYGIGNVSDEARADIRARLLRFATASREDFLAYLAATGDRPFHPRPGLFAHDYVLTVNRHATGFWDRGLGDLGDRLADAADDEGTWELYVGDDGRLYA